MRLSMIKERINRRSGYLLFLLLVFGIGLMMTINDNTKKDDWSDELDYAVTVDQPDQRPSSSEIGIVKIKGSIQIQYVTDEELLEGIDQMKHHPKYVLSRTITGDFFSNLGNSMFKFASLYGIAKANGLTLSLSSKNQLLQLFNVTDAVIIPHAKPVYIGRIYKEARGGIFDTRLAKPNRATDRAVIVEGFLQSWKYFGNYSQQIRRQFTFKDAIVSEAENVWRETVAGIDLPNPVTLVGVNVFRGRVGVLDSVGYQVPNKTFYSRAMNYYKQKYGKLRPLYYVIFSRDIEWATAAFRDIKNVIFLPRTNTVLSMAILTRVCDHTIVSLGSVGWWMGWLTGGDVVYYSGAVRPGSRVGKLFSPEDFYPKHWIKMA